MKDDLLQKSDIAHNILAYMVEHEAQDTLDGIVQWWLLEQEIKFQVERVKEVLAELVEKGLVLERKGADSRIRYGINRSKYGEIQAILKE